MNPVELKNNLAQFSGSDTFHKWSALFPHYYLTEGAKYLAEKAGAYWLMDAIASHQLKRKVSQEPFQVWKLYVHDKQASLVADDGNGNILTKQFIEYTDFPLETIKLYASYNGSDLVILLPNEN